MSGRQQGFTLIELMIVVAIIAILAAVALTAYLNYTIRSQVTEGLNLAGGAKSAVSEYYHERGDFPADNDAAAIAAPGDIRGKYVTAVTIADDVITITYGDQANTRISGETVTLTAADNSGSLTWTCASGGVIESEHLPGACR